MKDYTQVERDNAALTIREYAFGQMNMLRTLGDEDAANNLQEAINMAIAALRGTGWVRTVDRPPEGDEHKEVLGLYKGSGYLLYDIVQIGWLRLHPKMYPYWTHLPEKPGADDEY